MPGHDPTILSRLRNAATVREYQLACLATILWATISLAYGLGYGTTGIGRGYAGAMLFVITLTVPVALFWIIAALAARIRHASPAASKPAPAAQAAPLSTDEVDTMLRAVLAPIEPRFNQFDARLADLGKQARVISESLSTLSARLATDRVTLAEHIASALRRSLDEAEPAPEAAEADQAQLPLGTAKTQSTVGPTLTDIIRAANFPDSDSDFEAVNAIRQALKNRNMAQLLQAAEDILNLLAQDGIYMDDLHVAPGSAAQWRAFAAGKRGAEVASVGAIHDEDVLARARARARKDQIYRDTALHFQRRFDVILGDFARNASDSEVLALANTRTGRAFMLMARVSGTFD